MIKCFAPWTNIDVDYQGKLRPCCKFSIKNYQDPEYDLINGDFDKYLNSSMLDSVKQDLLADRWPSGCKKCKNDEAVDMISKRQRDIHDFEQLHQDVDFSKPSKIVSVTTELGISCNLACIICDHTKSTGWRPETKKIYNIAPAKSSYTRSTQRAIALTQLPPVQHLELQGGEPLTTNFDDHKFLLDHYISTGVSSNMTLRYHTNGTVWPSTDLWKRWKHFQSVDIKLSIDGVGSMFEFTRWPGRWETFERYAKKYCELRNTGKNIVVSAQITASAYNCMNLDSIYDWCYQHQITDIFLSKVLQPAHLQLNVWPSSARKVISESMKNSPNTDVSKMGHWLSTAPDIELFAEFVKFTETHSDYRKIDVSLCSKEFANLYSAKASLQIEDRDVWWNRFYRDVKDPSWPDCQSETLFGTLPEWIQHELVHLHQYKHARISNQLL